jgi:hypothetical protein
MEPRVASLVEQVTSIHCAPLLCAEEMKVIQGKDMHHGNMLVRQTAEFGRGISTLLSRHV